MLRWFLHLHEIFSLVNNNMMYGKINIIRNCLESFN